MQPERHGAAASACLVQPLFLDTPRGPLFAVHRRPATAVRGNVLCIPAFNEEMNRCRSMITLQAEEWARHGLGSLVIDLHGTGDSAGDYVDAAWLHWLDDIHLACAWLDQQPGGCVGYLGVRLGAMLAADALGAAPAGVRALLMWQPVIDGKQHFTQFLRVKIAAQMDRPDLPKESTASMRAQFAAGQAVEVAGYEIHPRLAQAIDEAQLARLVPRAGTSVLWLEQPPPGSNELSPASLAVQQAWQTAVDGVEWKSFEGPSFWQQYERVLAPQAITVTTAWTESHIQPS